MPTAVAVVIGNEILSGKFQDANSPWLATRCRALGIDLVRIHVIPDDVEIIASTVAAASALADHVFTTGGVGPTHDDLTMAGIASAFGVELERHPETWSKGKGHREIQTLEVAPRPVATQTRWLLAYGAPLAATAIAGLAVLIWIYASQTMGVSLPDMTSGTLGAP